MHSKCPHCSRPISMDDLATMISKLSDAERARVMSTSSIRAPSKGPVGVFEKGRSGKPYFIASERAREEFNALVASGLD